MVVLGCAIILQFMMFNAEKGSETIAWFFIIFNGLQGNVRLLWVWFGFDLGLIWVWFGFGFGLTYNYSKVFGYFYSMLFSKTMFYQF